ncbi:MAG TPA: Gfo/Idh/MocA family oxidoreductase [Xanthobacteraceae bacterium]|nr:Gfo/Idh/MocA family oxidoreductase [Xanthobacteraceae bacterium]
MLNAAIVGLGWWGQKLVRAAQGSKRIRFARAVTLEPELARGFAAETGLAVGTSYEDVLADPSIDAVVLATPHTSHRAQVEAAAAAGKHVYCEKPFALTKADAEAALAAIARAGITVGVGQHFRLMPSMQALRELVAGGALGAIMHAEGNYSHDWLANQPADNWRSAPEETRAGGMTGMGIHVLDGFSHLVGPMRRVAALSTRRVLSLPTGDTTAALVEFSDGATGTLATTLKTPFVWRIAVYGAEAWAESVSETRLVVHCAGREPETRDFAPVNHLGMNVEQFAAAALGEGAFPIDAAGILHTVAALEAVFRSAEANGAWQTVG